MAFGQDTKEVSYALDTLRKDSFFLIETTTIHVQGAPRSTVNETPVFFSDTMAFNLYILALRQRQRDLEAQKSQLTTEYTEVTAQVSDLTELRDSVFRGVTGFGGGGGGRSVLLPPNLSMSVASSTTWLVYKKPKGNPIDWLIPYDPKLPVKEDGFLLKPNGTIEPVKPKKK